MVKRNHEGGTENTAETIPYVHPAMRTADFWIHRAADAWNLAATEPLGQPSGLTDITGPDIPDPFQEVDDRLDGFNAEGDRWTDAEWDDQRRRVADASRLEACGFTVHRASLRRWPTDQPAFRTPVDREFDQLQETRLHLFQPLRITAETADGEWLAVTADIASGWIHHNDVGVANATDWKRYRRFSGDGIVVIDNGVFTQPQPYCPWVSNRPVEFAAYLPFSDCCDPKGLGNQNPTGQHVVDFPTRHADGTFHAAPALIKADARVHRGFLPPQRAALTQSIFRMLGDRYAWGDLLGTHDCSSLVMDSYRTLGIQIPRNSAVQARTLPLRIEWSREHNAAQRSLDLDHAELGDLLMMPGHVMMYLGQTDGHHYAIHAFVGYGLPTDQGLVPVPVNAVEVSSLSTPTRSGIPFIEALTRVARVL